MPKVNLSELGMSPNEVKPGDTLEMKVTSVNGDEVELSYDKSEVEKEMSMDEMNDPAKVKSMDSMSSDQMRKMLPKKSSY